jgi:hypothetical protein
MAKQGSYDFKQDIALMDYWLSTDFDSKKSIEITAFAVLKLFNAQNKIQFEFSNGQESNINYNTRGKFFTDTNETEIGTFTQLIFNKEALRPIDLTALFDKLKTLNNIVIRIENPDDENIFFNFKVNQITSHTSYFVFDVEVYQNLCLGSFLNAKRYNIFYDVKPSSETTTKTNSYYPSGW